MSAPRPLHANGDPAKVTMSRMDNHSIMRIRLEVNREVVEVLMELEDFALCLTGRGDTPATVIRHFVRPAPRS